MKQSGYKENLESTSHIEPGSRVCAWHTSDYSWEASRENLAHINSPRAYPPVILGSWNRWVTLGQRCFKQCCSHVQWNELLNHANTININRNIKLNLLPNQIICHKKCITSDIDNSLKKYSQNKKLLNWINTSYNYRKHFPKGALFWTLIDRVFWHPFYIISSALWKEGPGSFLPQNHICCDINLNNTFDLPPHPVTSEGL